MAEIRKWLVGEAPAPAEDASYSILTVHPDGELDQENGGPFPPDGAEMVCLADVLALIDRRAAIHKHLEGEAIERGGKLEHHGAHQDLVELRFELTDRLPTTPLPVPEEQGEADVITVYRRMLAAAEGARAERDIMRAAIETIAEYDTGMLEEAGEATAVEMLGIAQAAIDADCARREANLAALAISSQQQRCGGRRVQPARCTCRPGLDGEGYHHEADCASHGDKRCSGCIDCQPEHVREGDGKPLTKWCPGCCRHARDGKPIHRPGCTKPPLEVRPIDDPPVVDAGAPDWPDRYFARRVTGRPEERGPWSVRDPNRWTAPDYEVRRYVPGEPTNGGEER